MATILLIVQLFLALGIIGLVLMQKSDQDGFGLGSGSGMNVFNSRGQANFLTKSTAIFAFLFIVNSLALSIIASNASDRGSLAERIEKMEQAEEFLTVPAKESPAPAESENTGESQLQPVEAPAVPQAE